MPERAPDQPQPMPVACFAPALNDETLAAYRKMIDSAPEGTPVRDALETCWACVSRWWELPESGRKDGQRFAVMHRDEPGAERAEKTVTVTPLEKGHVGELYDVTPWLAELDHMSNAEGRGVFDSLTGDLRHCAFHLLWHVKEIALDREPLTHEALKG